MAQEARKIKKRDDQRTELDKMMVKFEREASWLRLNHLPLIKEPELELEQPPEVFGSEALKGEQRLPIENLLDRVFQHNRTKGDKLRIPAYNELEYIALVDKFINDYKIIDKTTPLAGLKLNQLRRVIL